MTFAHKWWSALSPTRRSMPARRKHTGDSALLLRGFTLIELLVVIAIIAATAGVLGLALRDGSPAAALQSAQGTFASLLSAARSQAALNQNRAVLAVEADASGDGFLRNIHVAVETAAGSNQWNLVSDAALPAGIYVVPGTTGIPGATCTPSSGVWPPKRLSAFNAPAALTVASGGSGVATFLVSTVEFTGTGKLGGTTGGDKFVHAPARRITADAVVFDNPDLVRGVVLSAYGSVILVNDGSGFDN